MPMVILSQHLIDDYALYKCGDDKLIFYCIYDTYIQFLPIPCEVDYYNINTLIAIQNFWIKISRVFILRLDKVQH